MDELMQIDVSEEEWREYRFALEFDGELAVDPKVKGCHLSINYRIEKPKTVYFRPNGSTHRVLDMDGITHVVPKPGRCGCSVRFKKR